MQTFKKLFSNFIKNLLLKKDTKTNYKYKRLVYLRENPLEVKKNTIYIVIGNKKPKWVYMKCPCGCNRDLSLPIMKNIKPNWSIDIDSNNKISVFPSVNVSKSECGSHFWIKKNRVYWVER